MKRKIALFMTLFSIIGLCMGAPPASSLVSRKGVKLTQEQLKTISAVQPWIGTIAKNSLHNIASEEYGYLGDRSKKREIGARKTNLSGSTIQGWRTTNSWSGNPPDGWYELSLDGSQKMLWEYNDPDWVDDGWNEEPTFPFNTGFMRNGKVTGFHSEMLWMWLIWGYGTFTLDGTIEEYHEFGQDFDVTDFSTYVLTCAYNPSVDMIYAYTTNSDATAYMFQSVNPNTWEFTPIVENVNLEDICIGFAYNPVDDKIYGMTVDSRFVTLNEVDGSLTELKKFNLPITTSLSGMTYSPLDKKFCFVFCDGQQEAALYAIDPVNPELEFLANLDQTLQYRILISPDSIIDSNAPEVPEILSIEFLEGALSGRATVRISQKTFGGDILSDSVEIIAYVDGEKYTVVAGEPGKDVTIDYVSLSEGRHNFGFVVSSGDLASPPVNIEKFLGYGIPVAPENIQFSNGFVTWDPVAESIDGGYIDRDNLSYNLFLNGDKINTEPVSQCSYEFIMPEKDYTVFCVCVEAVNHNHVSDLGYSNEICHGNPIPLPFKMKPTVTEAKLTTTDSDNPQYFKWEFTQVGLDIHPEQYFRCYTGSEVPRCEWLFMPPLQIPQTDKLIEVTFEAYAPYNAGTENISVGYGDEPNYKDMTIVKSWEITDQENWIVYRAYLPVTEGKRFIGFMTSTSETGYYIQIRNITIQESERFVSAPAEVSELTAVAQAHGALKADISFRLPSLTTSGEAITVDMLTASVCSSVESKTVSGAPGSMVSVEVSTMEGLNEISVYAANEYDGLESIVKVFTGLDIPQPIDKVEVSHNEDFSGLLLNWQPPTAGLNGGYIDPEKITYHLCLFDYETYSWMIAKDLETATSMEYFPENIDNIAMTEVGIATSNSKGICNLVKVVTGACGVPYSMPIWNDFNENALNPIISTYPDTSYQETF